MQSIGDPVARTSEGRLRVMRILGDPRRLAGNFPDASLAGLGRRCGLWVALVGRICRRRRVAGPVAPASLAARLRRDGSPRSLGKIEEIADLRLTAAHRARGELERGVSSADPPGETAGL